MHKRLRVAKAFGLLTGLSVTSFIGSHMARGTQALFTDTVTHTQTIKTCSYFPDTLNQQAGLVQQYAENANQNASDATNLANKAAQATTSSEATNYYNQAQDLMTQATNWSSKADAANQSLNQMVNQDAVELASSTDTESTSGGLQPRVALASSLPQWLADALNSGSKAMEQASGAITNIQVSLTAIQKDVSTLKTAEQQAALQQQQQTTNNTATSNTTDSGNTTTSNSTGTNNVSPGNTTTNSTGPSNTTTNSAGTNDIGNTTSPETNQTGSGVTGSTGNNTSNTADSAGSTTASNTTNTTNATPSVSNSTPDSNDVNSTSH